MSSTEQEQRTGDACAIRQPGQIKVIGSSPQGDEDPYITRIKASGCYESHVELQDCYFEKKDWRQCKEEMQKFKACFASKK